MDRATERAWRFNLRLLFTFRMRLSPSVGQPGGVAKGGQAGAEGGKMEIAVFVLVAIATWYWAWIVMGS